MHSIGQTINTHTAQTTIRRRLVSGKFWGSREILGEVRVMQFGPTSKEALSRQNMPFLDQKNKL